MASAGLSTRLDQDRSVDLSDRVADGATADECDLLIEDDMQSTADQDSVFNHFVASNKQHSSSKLNGRIYTKILNYLSPTLNSAGSSDDLNKQNYQNLYKSTPDRGGHQRGHHSKANNGGLSLFFNHLVAPKVELEQDRRRSPVGSRSVRLWAASACLFMLAICSILLITKLFILIEQMDIDSFGSNATGSLSHDEIDYKQLAEGKASRWLVSTSKCSIPVLEPWHNSIKEYVRRKPTANCSAVIAKAHKRPSLSFVHENRLFLTQEALALGAMQNCCLRRIERMDLNDDKLLSEKTCHSIKANGLESDASIVNIDCPRLNYTNVHSFVVEDKEKQKILQEVAARKMDEEKYYNVVIVGVDTISRLNGYRQLNRTLTLLRDKFEAIEMLGYNKVGENTFPNLIPLLTGLTPEQLVETHCWLVTNYSQETETGDDYLDNCMYLWNYYQELGYLTYFSEDWPKASTFNYLKQGFKREPTSFYGRPFTIARDYLLYPRNPGGCTLCHLDRPTVEVDLENLENFLRIHRKRPYFAFHWINCPQHDDLNGASQIDLTLERFFERILELTQSDRTFVVLLSDHGYRWNDFVSTRVGHYESSLPMLNIAPPKEFIKNHPDLYKNLIQHRKSLITPFDMFRTLIDLRNIGMKTNFATDWPTKSSLSRLARAAIGNNNVTISPADTDETPGPTASTTVKQLQLDGLTFRQEFKTLSLLRDNNRTDLDRSCIDAGIPDSYCVCHQFEKMDISSSDALGAAYYLVYVHMYLSLEHHTNLCRTLDFDKLHQAELFDFKQMKQAKNRRRRYADNITVESITTTPSPKNSINTDKEEDIDEHSFLPNREYNIRISTKPGGGLFQEVVRYYGEDLSACVKAVDEIRGLIEDPSTDHKLKHSEVIEMNKDCRFSIHSDSLSRLNLYKGQSDCVKNNIELKKICYCNNL